LQHNTSTPTLSSTTATPASRRASRSSLVLPLSRSLGSFSSHSSQHGPTARPLRPHQALDRPRRRRERPRFHQPRLARRRAAKGRRPPVRRRLRSQGPCVPLALALHPTDLHTLTPRASHADLVADALRPLLALDLPLVLSHLDSRANLRAHASDKGKARADPPSSASPADAAPPHSAHEDEDDAAAPAGFDLDPAVPAPPTTVPRSAGRYTLPDGVDKDECALLWIGGESLALNNVLLVHGRCRVRRALSPSPSPLSFARYEALL